MAKKTVSIQRLVEMVNARNMKSTCSAAVREGWNSLLESVLMEADAYAGFGYIPREGVPAGELPGIVRGETMAENVFPDETRKFFYLGK